MSSLDLIIQPDAEDNEAAEVLVDGTVGGRPYRLLLDTGAAKTSLLYDEYTSTFVPIDRHTSSGVFAGGSDDVIVVPELAIGPIVRKDVAVTRVAEGAPIPRSLIDMDILKDERCHFLFDQRHVSLDTPGADDNANLVYHELLLN